MTTIALDENWDVIVDANGCLATVDGCEEIIQCIRQRLNIINFSEFVDNNFNVEFISSIIKSAINDVDGVIAISSFSVVRDDINCGIIRGLRFSFSAITNCGNISLGV